MTEQTGPQLDFVELVAALVDSYDGTLVVKEESLQKSYAGNMLQITPNDDATYNIRLVPEDRVVEGELVDDESGQS